MNNYKPELVKVIEFWRNVAIGDELFSRRAKSEINLQFDEVVVIIGPRRSGKSSLLKLLIRDLPPQSWLYVNFEDPFFLEHNKVSIIEDLVESYLDNFSSSLKYLFFDEVQNIDNWEKAVRKFQEINKYKIFITGSSSKLLSKELSTLLTGRHKTIKVLPLSFQEFLEFRNFEVRKKADLIIKDNEIKKMFHDYLSIGGFPKVVLENRPEVLKQYYSDILEKDIVGRHKIRQKEKLERLGVYLLTNVANVYSLSNLSRVFELSRVSTLQYIHYFKEAFVLDELKQFSYSLKSQEKAFNKIYSLDNGLVTAVSFRFSDNLGAALENCAFNYFLDQYDECYYYKTKTNSEIDFVLRSGGEIEALVQLCSDVSIEKTTLRETKALIEASEELNCSNLVVATFDFEGEKTLKAKKINFIPFYKIMLGLYKI